ncbi:YbaB/EbfC family nucleoid-associated protein [Dyadobacter sp. CY312]|jgi:DNA-binding YbaB/EbfC family protein|uniref:YbaB/EbfC family nucleoid-associated protein n=1 Tax=Dyadobacter sp. CY312 TaxID=2907303 RepID=UPI001F01874B|nr:YbaB/EbfC family nucleoid-associated protein [Dyadobacter sp. CY312]MCE7042181.1 YbaB/EbfC family nucleoid-associated protein [Dyadobacter sp. CY312]
MFGNMADMMGLMGKMKDLQSRMKDAQEQLATIIETAESGGGMVKATVNGQKSLIGLDIDKDLINPDDKEMLQDLIVAAVNKAYERIEPKIKEHLQKATDGVLPNIPGLDLGGLMK